MAKILDCAKEHGVREGAPEMMEQIRANIHKR